jgi:hypothetical protein
VGFQRAPGTARALAVGLGLGLGLASKFSAVLLLPVVALALAMAKGPGFTPRGRLAAAGAAALGALAVPAAVYLTANWRYDSQAGRRSLAAYCEGRGTLVVDHRLEPWKEPLLAVERASPGLAQWLLGAAGVGAQNAVGVYPSYAFGEIRSRGRWWYFPAVLAVKTPLPLVAASLLALVAWVQGRRRRQAGAGRDPRDETAPDRDGTGVARGLPAGARAVLGLALAVYLAAAVAGNYNLGSRHLLPILPLLYLPAALWAARKWSRAALLAGLLFAEAVALTPLWMSATNTWWLGEENPSRFALGAGDTEYKQNFLELALAVEERGATEVGVLFPGTTDEEVAANVPGGRAVGPGDPLPPGWYAVSVLAEQSLPAILRADSGDLHGYASLRALAEAWEPLRREIAAGEDHGYAAGSFHLYRRPSPGEGSAEAGAER